MGRLKGVTDFKAYQQMGDVLHAAGKLGNPEPKQSSEPAETNVKKAKDLKEVERKIRKKAASSTKSTSTAQAKTYDPLSLSDEDFAKFDPKKFVVKT